MARVQVLSTPGCAACDQIKRLIAKVLIEFPGIESEEIDLTEHPELAARYGIMSVPAVVIDGKLELAHMPKEEALRQKIQAASERS
jgi:glutaredoxin